MSTEPRTVSDAEFIYVAGAVGLGTRPTVARDEFRATIAKVKADSLRRARQRIVDALPDAPSKAQEGRMKYAVGFLGVLADEVEGGDRDA